MTLAEVSPNPPWLNGKLWRGGWDGAGVKKLGKAPGNGGVVVLGELGCDVGRQHPELVDATGACAVEEE